MKHNILLILFIWSFVYEFGKNEFRKKKLEIEVQPIGKQQQQYNRGKNSTKQYNMRKEKVPEPDC